MSGYIAFVKLSKNHNDYNIMKQLGLTFSFRSSAKNEMEAISEISKKIDELENQTSIITDKKIKIQEMIDDSFNGYKL
jgi:chaperonin cofactor prefoldin